MLHFNPSRRILTAIACLFFAATTSYAQYCIPDYTTGTVEGDYLDIFSLGAIYNATGAGAEYNDYTAMSTDLVAGSSYTATITNTPTWGENYQIWIDYNHNGVFDAIESAGSTYILAGGTGTITFTVPLTAMDGTTVLRVRCIYGGIAPYDPCGVYSFGETEDYSVNITGGGAPVSGCTDPTAMNYNPDAVIDDGSCFFGYTYSTCTYDLMSTEGTAVCLGDDVVSSVIPMGFDFPFYGINHSDIYISSNGFVTFNSGIGSGCCSGQILPNALYPNSIFMGQEDLDPNSCVDGVINYYTSGGAGSHVFVVNFVGVPHYPGPAGTFNCSMQLQLHEATGEIKVVVTEWNSDGGTGTLGLNFDGMYADPAPGKNASVWSAYEECHSWMPVGGAGATCPAPTGLYADGITTNDAVLHWDTVPGADQYRVTLYNLATGLIKKKGYYTNYVELVDKLTPMTEYGFRVTTVCYDEGIKSAPSEWVYFTTLGRFGENENASLSLFPNPNNGSFTIALNGLESSNFDVMVFDAIGNVVYAKSITANSNTYSENIDLDVPSGMYHVSIKNALGQMDYPVVIQK